MERLHTSNLAAYMKALEQKEVIIPKRGRQQEITTLRNEINKIWTKKTILITKELFFCENQQDRQTPIQRKYKAKREYQN